jgi:hypothetical protein
MLSVVEWIIKITLGVLFLGLIFALIPPIPLPTEVSGAIEWLTQLLVNFNFVLPVGTMFTILSMVFTVELILLVIKAVGFIKNHLNI